jgi:hypothetical protein
MAANASDRAQRNAILGSRLSDFATWFLWVDCGTEGCRRDRLLSVGELAAMFPRETVAGMLRRFRCRECDGKAIAASIQSGLGETRGRRLRAVALVG